MAADPARQRVLLGGLLVVLALVVWWQIGWSDTPASDAVTAPKARPAAASRSTATPAETLSAGVGLDRLARVPPLPVHAGRDPFVLGREAPEPGLGNAGGPRGGSGGGAPVPSVTMPPAPTGPPPPPPIAVKFIGVVERGDVGRVAVLSDGRNVYYGREGEIVDGRWRIVRIGEESLQIEYVDGQGRQTVRLTG